MAQFLFTDAREVVRVLKKKHQIFFVLILFTVSPACGGPAVLEDELSYLTEDEVIVLKPPVVGGPSPWFSIIWRTPSFMDPPLNGVPPVIPWLPNPFTEDLSVPYKSPLKHYSPLAQWQEKKVVAAAGYTARGQDKLFRLHAYLAALADFEKALSFTPESARVYDARATARLQFATTEAARDNTADAQRLFHAALTDFEKALSLTPADTRVYGARATANLQLGIAEAARGNTVPAQRFFHAALKGYTQVLAHSREKIDAYLFRGYAKFKLGTLESDRGNAEQARHHHHTAIADVNQAMTHCRKDASILKEALALHTDIGVASKEAMEIRGSYAFAHYVRGLAKEALGHRTAATDFRKAKALQLVPEGRPWTFLVASKFGRVNLGQ